MANELSIYDRFEKPGEFILVLGKAIYKSGMFGCENLEQGQIYAFECAARRCPPMTLAERYHNICGRLSMKADVMLGDFHEKCHGSHRVITRTADKASIELTVNGQTQTFSLSWDEAQQEPFVYMGREQYVVEKLRAGKVRDLTIKPKYSTPRSRMQMFWARVVSDGVRTMAPEVVSGSYTPEEISDFVEDAIVVEKEVPKEPPAVEPTPTVEPTVEQTVEPEPEPTPEPAKEAPRGVRLDGTEPPASEPLSTPCGEEVSNEIKAAAKAAGWGVDRLIAVLKEAGVKKLVELPMKDAKVLLARLEAAASELNAPF